MLMQQNFTQVNHWQSSTKKRNAEGATTRRGKLLHVFTSLFDLTKVCLYGLWYMHNCV